MPSRKKKFIDKKNATTFTVVHRSQRDPLQASDTAPEHVLLPQIDKFRNPEKRREEQRKYGVFFEDDYNYLQHLKDTREIAEECAELVRIERSEKDRPEKGLLLPSTLFASTMEANVGLLSKAAPHSGPRLDWDPDILAALDSGDEQLAGDGVDMDVELEDDFVVRANAEGGEFEPSNGVHGGASYRAKDLEHCLRQDAMDSIGEDDSTDRMRHMLRLRMPDLETGDSESSSRDGRASRFTEYSMSSSVLPRNEGLRMLDDQFEEFYAQYDDLEIGSAELEDTGGSIRPTSERFMQLVAEHSANKHKLAAVNEKEEDNADGDISEVSKMDDKCVCVGTSVEQDGRATEEKNEDDDAIEERNEEDEEKLVKMVVAEPPDKRWDCESIVSSYSTLYNHPTRITEESFGRKTSRISDSASDTTSSLHGLTYREVQASQTADGGREQPNTFRPKHETPEAKKLRKEAVKQHRRERRIEKKANKEAFREETCRQKSRQALAQQYENVVKLS